MGLSGVSLGELLIVLVIVLLIFGSGRLARAGSDLGSAMRGFRKAMGEDGPPAADAGAASGPGALAAGDGSPATAAGSRTAAPAPHADSVSRD